MLASRFECAYARVTKWMGRLAVAAVVLLVEGSMPVAAAHGSLPCDPPPGFGPLFQLMHDIGQLAQLSGIVLGFIGFSIAGVMFVIPGPEWNQRGKRLAKAVIIGAIILLSANLIMAFLVSHFPVCTGQ